jgi:hypothetical protein
MKPRQPSTRFKVIVALAAFAVFGILHNMTNVSAQTRGSQPDTERLSFGLVSITSGQSIRVNVVNTRAGWSLPLWTPREICFAAATDRSFAAS